MNWDSMFSWELIESGWEKTKNHRFKLCLTVVFFILLSALLTRLPFGVGRGISLFLSVYYFWVITHMGIKFLASKEIDFSYFKAFFDSTETIKNVLISGVAIVTIDYLSSFISQGVGSGIFNFIIVTPLLAILNYLFITAIYNGILFSIKDGADILTSLKRGLNLVFSNLLGFIVMGALFVALISISFLTLMVGGFFIFPIIFLFPSLMLHKMSK